MLAINLATRGRPDLLLDTLETTLGNIVCADTKLVVSVDDDDPGTIAALEPYCERECGVIVSVLPREDSLGEKYNRVLTLLPKADAYLVMVDYAPHMTRGFDKKILDALRIFPDKIGAVFNQMANASFPGINAVTRKLATMMGGIYPPYFPYWFVDHWFDDIVRIIDRVAFADVVIDVSRRPDTMERREVYFWATFFDALMPERVAIAGGIIDSRSFREPRWRKDLLRNRWPMVAERSLMINEFVRRSVQRSEISQDQSSDARYERIKAKAMAKLQPIIESYKQAA